MLRIALPALAEEFLVLMVTWTDWLLASRYFVEDGDATKAAMGLMAYLMWLIPSLFAVVAIGATALIARWIGANELTLARKAANQAYFVAVFIALALTTVVWLFGKQFILLMQLEGDAAEYAHQYLRVITPLIPWIMLSQVGAACLRGAGDTFSGFATKLVVVIVNLIVSITLVVGLGPIEPIGWKGIAIGTASGYAVGGTIIFALLVFGRAGLKLRLRWMLPDVSILKKMFRIGIPGGFDIATLLFCQLLFLAIINSLGKASAAAHGLAVQIEACAFLPGAAFQVAAATMAGQFLGAGANRRASRSTVLCLALGGAIMCISGLGMYFYGVEIAAFFTGDPSHPTTLTVGRLLKIISIGLPSLAIVMIVSGGFRGSGDTLWLFYFTAFGFLVVRIPLACLLAFDTFEIPLLGLTINGFGWGVAGAWYAMLVDVVIRSFMTLARFFHGGWKHIKI